MICVKDFMVIGILFHSFNLTTNIVMGSQPKNKQCDAIFVAEPCGFYFVSHATV